MNTNIRIIKRSQRDAKNNTTTTPDNNRQATRDNSRQAARDITGHVTNWVKEFQRKHTPDPRRAFANLFVDAATSTAE